MSQTIRESGTAFVYLQSLLEGDTERVIRTPRARILISSVNPPNEELLVVVQIYPTTGSEERHEAYIVASEGCVEASFSYPPWVNYPPAPTLYPADMTLEQERETAKKRADAIVKYIREALNVK